MTVSRCFNLLISIQTTPCVSNVCLNIETYSVCEEVFHSVDFYCACEMSRCGALFCVYVSRCSALSIYVLVR